MSPPPTPSPTSIPPPPSPPSTPPAAMPTTPITTNTLTFTACPHTLTHTYTTPLPPTNPTNPLTHIFTDTTKPLCPSCYLSQESQIINDYSYDLDATVTRAKRDLESPTEMDRACEKLYDGFGKRFWGFQEICGGWEEVLKEGVWVVGDQEQVLGKGVWWTKGRAMYQIEGGRAMAFTMEGGELRQVVWRRSMGNLGGFGGQVVVERGERV